MNPSEVNELWPLIERLLGSIERKDGPFQSWSGTLADGRSQKYEVRGMADLKALGDNVRSAFVWLWHHRDHLVKQALAEGRTEEEVYARVNSEHVLMLCHDLANKLKHVKLSRPKTEYDLTIESATAHVPMEAIGVIGSSGDVVWTDIANPELIDISMPITDPEAGTVEDALVLLRKVVHTWESIGAELFGGSE